MTTTSGVQALEQGISATNRAFEIAFSEGNAAKAAAVYSSAGTALPPGGPYISGRAELQAFWQGVMDMGVKRVTLETLELEAMGEGACEVGRATLFTADGSIVDTVKFVVVWRQEAGAWKWHKDIWNSLGS